MLRRAHRFPDIRQDDPGPSHAPASARNAPGSRLRASGERGGGEALGPRRGPVPGVRGTNEVRIPGLDPGSRRGCEDSCPAIGSRVGARDFGVAGYECCGARTVSRTSARMIRDRPAHRSWSGTPPARACARPGNVREARPWARAGVQPGVFAERTRSESPGSTRGPDGRGGAGGNCPAIGSRVGARDFGVAGCECCGVRTVSRTYAGMIRDRPTHRPWPGTPPARACASGGRTGGEPPGPDPGVRRRCSRRRR